MTKENLYKTIKSNPNASAADLGIWAKIRKNDIHNFLSELEKENKIKYDKKRGWDVI